VTATDSQVSLAIPSGADTLEDKMQEIIAKYEWLSKKVGKGVEEHGAQKDLDDMFDFARGSPEADDHETSEQLDGTIKNFNEQIDAKKIDTITENYEWLIKNTLKKSKDPTSYKRALKEKWYTAQGAFYSHDSKTLDDVYRDFRHYKRVAETSQHESTARDIMYHLENVSKLQKKPAEGYEARGSRPSTITEVGSSEERSSRGGSENGSEHT